MILLDLDKLPLIFLVFDPPLLLLLRQSRCGFDIGVLVKINSYTFLQIRYSSKNKYYKSLYVYISIEYLLNDGHLRVDLRLILYNCMRYLCCDGVLSLNTTIFCLI